MKNDLEPICNGRNEPLPLLQYLKEELLKGKEIIDAVDDLSFRRSANGTGSVGAQFRHNVDFVSSFLNGIDDGRVDYGNRERDQRVEEDRDFAAERILSCIRRLDALSPGQFSKSLLVRSEVDPATWLPSSFVRELEFVYSHTVHHHALIREKLAGFGIEPSARFGVALSTLEYWDRKAA